MTNEDTPTGPPFTVERYGSLGESIIGERDWLRQEVELLKAIIRTTAFHLRRGDHSVARCVDQIIEAHEKALDGTAHEPCDGYRGAFFKIAELLDIPAMPVSPKEAFETVMLPMLRALIEPASREASLEPPDVLEVARWQQAQEAMCHSFDGENRTHYLKAIGRESFTDTIDRLLRERHAVKSLVCTCGRQATGDHEPGCAYRPEWMRDAT